MERYFYFGEGAVGASGTAAMYPLSAFIGMTAAGATSTSIKFNARNGAAVDDTVAVTHTGHTSKAFMAEMVNYLQRNHRNPFLVVADGVDGTFVTSKIASVAVTTIA
tara:strand:+ start:391 stop:711 length:321 start_codon:yes stop_codon:yes gene_type:complete